MFQELLNPQLLLALAKITAILVASFGLSLLIKRPDLRASFWIAAILSLPLVFALSFSFSVLEVIPQEEKTAPLQVAAPAPNPIITPEPAEVSPPIAPTETYLVHENALVETPDEPIAVDEVSVDSPSVPWILVIYLSGALLVLIPWLISLVQVMVLNQ